jgi:hypothetical protein
LGLAACIPDLPPGAIDGDDASDAWSVSSSGPASGSGASGSGSSSGPGGSGGSQGCGDGYIDLASGEQCDPGPAAGDASLAGCAPDCTMECPSGFTWARNNHCYELMPDASSSLILGAGRGTCTPAFAHVVTFASEDEFVAVAAQVDAGSFWVGLQESSDSDKYDSIVDYEPGWSTVCSGCYAHNADLKAGLPKGSATGSGGAFCVEALTDLTQASWRAAPCSGLDPGLPVVCEREPVGSQGHVCEGGAGICITLVWTRGAKLYVYREVPASAAAAEQACADLGGRLVVLESRDEREQLWHELGKMTVKPTQGIWVGLSRVAALDGGLGEWTWDDDAAASSRVSPWGYGQPRTSGPGLTTRAYMLKQEPPLSDDTLARDDAIAGTLPYVCEIPQGDAGR